jgi:hypothetical protein
MGGMYVKPRKSFKATLVGLTHDSRPAGILLEHQLEKFRQILDVKKRSGKTLYIEGSQAQVDENIRAPELESFFGYGKVVNAAKERGMNVVGLESEKLLAVSQKIRNNSGLSYERMSAAIGMPSFTRHEFDWRSQNHSVYSLREKKWKLALRKTSEGDLVVMHPDHAARVYPQWGIPPQNVHIIGSVSHPIHLPGIAAKIRKWRNQYRQHLMQTSGKWDFGKSLHWFENMRKKK